VKRAVQMIFELRAACGLGERLVRRGVVADIFIVGGAAMALAYDAARVTRDVDAMFKPHGIVHEEASGSRRTSGSPAGGSTSRQAPTSPASRTLTSAAYSIIPGCASWPLTTSHLRDEGTRGQNA
jgi:hypothetical protein